MNNEKIKREREIMRKRFVGGRYLKTDRYEKIVMKTKQDMYKVFEWAEINGISMENLKGIPVNLPLNEALFCITESDMMCHYIKSNDDIQFTLTFYGGLICAEWTYHQYQDKFEVTSILGDNEWENDPYRYVKSAMQIFMCIMNYMLYYREDSSRIQKSHNLRQPSSKKRKAGKNVHAVKIGRYTVSIPSIEKVNKTLRQKHVDGFWVRGFWRTYPSGKVGWVNGYPKGEARTNPEKYRPKIYEV